MPTYPFHAHEPLTFICSLLGRHHLYHVTSFPSCHFFINQFGALIPFHMHNSSSHISGTDIGPHALSLSQSQTNTSKHNGVFTSTSVIQGRSVSTEYWWSIIPKSTLLKNQIRRWQSYLQPLMRNIGWVERVSDVQETRTSMPTRCKWFADNMIIYLGL